MSQLSVPAHWDVVSMEELVGPDAPIVYGIIQAGPDVPGGVPYIRPTELVDGGIDVAGLRRTSPVIARKYARSVLREGDIILAIVGTIGKLAVVPRELEGANITQSSARLRPPPGLAPGFLEMCLASPQLVAQFDKMKFGVAVQRLNLAHVRALQVPMPPPDEQRRIVEKLSHLQDRSRRAREALEAVPPLLEKLRQSILAAAFRGDLTKDWRAQNPDVEPASELLKRIRVERRKKWEEAELAKMAAKGKAPAGEAWKAKYREPEPVDAAGLPELPEGWCWAAVDELLSEGLTNGRSVPTDDAGFPVLRLTALRGGEFDLAQRKGGAWTAAEARPYLVQEGDFLVSRGNGSIDLVARGGLVRGRPDPVAFPDTLIRVRVHRMLLRDYLALVWAGPGVRRQIERRAKTTAGIYKVSQGDLERVVLPVPPIGEQDVIVRTTRGRLALLAERERSHGIAAAALQQLGQAVLARAFRGDLVPQATAEGTEDLS